MKGKGSKGTCKRTRSSKCLHGDQALTDHSEPTMMADVSQLDTVHSYPKNCKGLNGDNNIKESLKKSMGSKSSNENIIVALFGVPLSSIEDLDVLTRKIKAGDYDKIKKLVNSVEWKAVMAAIEAEWKKLLTDVTSATNATRASLSKRSTGKANFHHLVSDNVFDVVQLSIMMNLVQTAKYGLTRLMMNSKVFFFFKFNSIKGLEDVLESGPWMIHNSPIILKKWTMNTRPCKEEVTLISVWAKIHEVLIQVFSKDDISLIASQIADGALKDNIILGIHLPEGIGFTKETIRVGYKWKPPCCEQCKIFGHMYDQCPKNPIKQKVTFNPKSHGNSQKANDGNIVHLVSKEKPSKAANDHSSS
nr:hypothetical protein [Tanacetum cinerariifolium]